MAKQSQKATQEQLAGRRQFDAAMNRLLDGKQMITRLTAEAIMKLTGFNIRRAAYYINNRNKKLLQEAADFWRRQFDGLGGLPTKCIAWSPPGWQEARPARAFFISDHRVSRQNQK